VRADGPRGRFTGLTVGLFTLALLATALPQGDVHGVVVDVAFSILLLFAIRTVGPRLRVATIVLAAPSFFGHWALYSLPASSPIRSLVFLSTTVFMAFLALIVILAVLRDPVVTADTVVGGICAYFLIAIAWGNAYALAELLSPGSFVLSPALAAAVDWRPPASPISPVLQYFSLSTLTTLGFGDVTPLSRGARTLAALEAMVGQLYLAILIARLVGIHSARSSA
jgi:hypothetical protein